jgi:hypothetical protein
MEGTRELVKERKQKQALQIRVEEMQTDIEQKILHLRKHLDLHSDSESTRLRTENERLRTKVDEIKVSLAIPRLTQASYGHPVIALPTSNSPA